MENRIRYRKYDETVYLAQAALDTIRGNSDCQVSDSVFLAALEAYEHPANYLKWQEQAMESLEDKDFEMFMNLYEKLITYYRQHQLSEFGIATLDLEIILDSNPDEMLYRQCINYYCDKKEYRIAYRILVKAFNKGFDSRDFRNAQEIVGSGLASDDNQTEVMRSEKVAEYDKEDKWFRYLRNAYLQYH
ncbi:MAG: hypothetical protein P8100_01315 [bacterium]